MAITMSKHACTARITRATVVPTCSPREAEERTTARRARRFLPHPTEETAQPPDTLSIKTLPGFDPRFTLIPWQLGPKNPAATPLTGKDTVEKAHLRLGQPEFCKRELEALNIGSEKELELAGRSRRGISVNREVIDRKIGRAYDDLLAMTAADRQSM